MENYFKTAQSILVLCTMLLRCDKGSLPIQTLQVFQRGKLNEADWNNLQWKHLDHHLRQFGV
jgi:hypothetical protein